MSVDRSPTHPHTHTPTYRFLALVLLLAACGAATPSHEVQWTELDQPISLEGLNLNGNDAGGTESAAPEALPLAEAQARLPFTLALPAWVPEGFTRQEPVEVVQPGEGGAYASITVTWENADGAALALQVATAAANQPRLGAGGQAEPVTVNGEPATLVRVPRSGEERLVLTWTHTGLAYQLAADPGATTAEDLQKMAASIG